MNNSFNLVDEGWIPIKGIGLASLGEVFSTEGAGFTEIEGNAVVKLSIFKLLLAIVQASGTPEDEDELMDQEPSTMASVALGYLKKNHDLFYLYGERPFLQIPQMECAKAIPLQKLLPDLASEGGNKTAFRSSEVPRVTTNPERARIVVKEGGFSFGGKSADKNVTLSPGHTKRSAGCGPSLGAYGVLHSFVLGKTLQESLYYNILPLEEIESLKLFEDGLGDPPWERMPGGEVDEIANKLKNSYIGRLVPISRFLLLKKDEEVLHYSEGIPYPKLNDGYHDPSMTIANSEGKLKTIWAKVDKKPWRSVSALLSFLDKDGKQIFHNRQLKLGFSRMVERGTDGDDHGRITIWSAGLQVNSNSGEQYVTQGCDYIDSTFPIPGRDSGVFKHHMDISLEFLEQKSKRLYGCIRSYYTKMGNTENAKITSQVLGRYWLEVEQLFFEHLNSLRENRTMGDEPTQLMDQFRKRVRKLVAQLYNNACPQTTARQLSAWAENHPSRWQDRKE